VFITRFEVYFKQSRDKLTLVTHRYCSIIFMN